MVVILFGLDCFINSVLAYFHISHIHCLIISLNWYFVIWGSKRSMCFIHYFRAKNLSKFRCEKDDLIAKLNESNKLVEKYKKLAKNLLKN